MHFDDPAFWRAGAISTVAIMSVVLVMLTIDSLAVISPGGANVPPYTVINQHIDYKFDAKRGQRRPCDRTVRTSVRQVFGCGRGGSAHRQGQDGDTESRLYRTAIPSSVMAPTMLLILLRPGSILRGKLWQAMTGAATREEAMVKFLMEPEKYRTWTRAMPNLGITQQEAEATVAYLKWMAAVDTNGFPPNFGRMQSKP